MAMFVLVMWITLVWAIIAKHVEARQPVRETRGFSRAQTGDGITAVLPMTWSITMLMHASTHSVNFDENTTGTLFTLTVIAYQWGWNYYYPRDVVGACWAAPKQLGHGAVAGTTTAHYDFLLGTAQRLAAGHVAADFRFASRAGRNVAPNVLSLFLRPPHGASGGDLCLPTAATSL